MAASLSPHAGRDVASSTPPFATSARVSVSSLLDSGPWTGKQQFMVFLSALAIVMDGFDGQLIGYAAPVLLKEWGLERSAFAVIIAIGLIGMGVGSAVAGIVGDRFGRKVATVGSVLIFGFSTVASGFVTGPEGLAICRFITGLGVGGALPSATTFAAEFAPPKYRTMAVTAAIICVPVGGMLAGLFASVVLADFGWRTLFLAGGALPVLLGLGLAIGLVESPRWLAEKGGNNDRLRALLDRIGKTVPASVEVVADSVDQSSAARQSFGALFREGRLTSTLCLWASCFLVLLSVYTAFSWLPTMLTADGRSTAIAGAGLTTYNLGGVVGGMFCAWTVTRFGSRIPLIAFCAGGALSAFLLSMLPSHSSPASLIIGLGVHGLFVTSVQCLLYSLTAYVYPTRIRARGTAWTLTVGRLGAITSAFVGAAIISRTGGTGYFLMLACAMVGAMIVLAILPRHIPVARKAASDRKCCYIARI